MQANNDASIAEKNIVEISESELNAIAEEKFQEFVHDETANPFLLIKKKIEQLNKQVLEYEQECIRLTKFCENIVQNQEKHLRKKGLLPRVPTRNVGVNVNITYVNETSALNSASKQSVPVSNTNASNNKPFVASEKTQIGAKSVQLNISSPQGNNAKKPQTNRKSDQILPKTVSSSPTLNGKSSDKPVDFIDLTGDRSAKLQNTHNSVLSKSPFFGVKAVRNKIVAGKGNRTVDSVTSHSTTIINTVPSTSFVRPLSNTTSFRVPVRPLSGAVQQNIQGQKIAYISFQKKSSVIEPRMNFHAKRVGDVKLQYVTPKKPSVLPAVVITNRPRILSTSVRPQSNVQVVSAPRFTAPAVLPRHPAPLPLQPSYSRGVFLEPPPKPCLEIRAVNKSITLQWNLSLNDTHAEIANYQLYGYEEANEPIDSSLWKKVGDIKALPLPMACTLTQFGEKKYYHFTVRAVDIHSRPGPFSDPVTVFISSVSG